MPQHSPAPTPERALYGFVLYISSFLLFGLYIVWAYLPEKYLLSVGLDFFPKQYWAVAIPSFFVLCFIFFLVSYFFINLNSSFALKAEIAEYDHIPENLDRKDLSNLLGNSVLPVQEVEVKKKSEINSRTLQTINLLE